MHIEVLIPCVGYGDYLAATLPENKRWFKTITVLTAPEDVETIALARQEGVDVFVTSVWREGKAKFDKAGAINAFLDERKLDGTDAWILSLDADILLRSDLGLAAASLDPRALYSVKRRTCQTHKDWLALCAGQRGFDDLPLDVAPIVRGKAWRRWKTNNPAGLYGYLQLWHATEAVGMKRMPVSRNAATYDVLFALSFPDAMRFFIDGHDVLHLGPTKVNWNGRRSRRWTPETESAPSIFSIGRAFISLLRSGLRLAAGRRASRGGVDGS